MPRTRSGEPIHRHSLEKGTFERAWYRPIAPRDGHRLQVAAERYDREGRKPGERNGPIGHVGQELLGLLIRLQHRNPEGRLEPAYLTLARMLKRSIDAVWRAIGRLEAAGILERARRVAPVIEADSWRWQQTSNAYRILFPAWVAGAVPAVMKPVPVAEDLAHAAAARERSARAMERTLPRDEYARHVVEEPGLAGALARLGRAFGRQHDSVRRSESLTVNLSQEDCGVAHSGDEVVAEGAPAAPDGAAGRCTARPVPT